MVNFDANGSKLKEFKNSTTLDGLRFNLEGLPELGDEFTVRVSNNLSENLKIKVTDGRQLAASSFYSVEPSGSNNSKQKLVWLVLQIAEIMILTI